MIVKAPARINTNLKPPPTISGPPVGAVDPRLRKSARTRPARQKPDTKVAGAGDKRKETLEDIKKRLPMADADPKVIWQEVFEKGIDDPGLVIACADYMVDAGRFEHAAEFLKANLRQGVVVSPVVYGRLRSPCARARRRRRRSNGPSCPPATCSRSTPAVSCRHRGPWSEQKRFERAVAYCRQAAQSCRRRRRTPTKMPRWPRVRRTPRR
jgi:hypothetical protein